MSLEDRIRNQLNKINKGSTPGPGMYNSDIYSIVKKLQQSKPFASLRSNHESSQGATFDLIDQRLAAKSQKRPINGLTNKKSIIAINDETVIKKGKV